MTLSPLSNAETTLASRAVTISAVFKSLVCKRCANLAHEVRRPFRECLLDTLCGSCHVTER